MLGELPWQGYLFAVLVLFAVRSAATFAALSFSMLDWRERLVAAWFGPKGFASVIYGVMVLDSAVPQSGLLFELIAVVIAASIVLHSSTDIFFVRWFREPQPSKPSRAISVHRPRGEPVHSATRHR